MDEIAMLRRVPLFVNMDEQEVAGIRAIMEPNVFAPGQVIFREGEPGNHFHVIMEGNVEFITQDSEANELVLDSSGPGGFFGELSLLTGGPRSARVRAVDKVSTLALDREQFHEFLLKHPHAALDVLQVLGNRLKRSDELLRRSVSQNVNELQERKMTLGLRIADGFAAVMGSWAFIIIQSIILTIWVITNVIFRDTTKAWDPYPFILLNLALSFQAAYAAPIIMMSQNRQSDKDRLAAEIDHNVNKKAEIEVALIMRRLDDLERGMHHNHHEQCNLLRDVRPAVGD